MLIRIIMLISANCHLENILRRITSLATAHPILRTICIFLDRMPLPLLEPSMCCFKRQGYFVLLMIGTKEISKPASGRLVMNTSNGHYWSSKQSKCPLLSVTTITYYCSLTYCSLLLASYHRVIQKYFH